MASSSTVDGDLVIRGTCRPNALAVPASCVGDDQIDPSNPITAPNLQHQHVKTYNQANGTAVVSETRAIHVGYSTDGGTILAFRCGLLTACIGAATVTVDLKKNGATVLSAIVTLNAAAGTTIVTGAISTAAFTVGDVLTIVVTATAGGGTIGQGLWVDLIVDEWAN